VRPFCDSKKAVVELREVIEQIAADLLADVPTALHPGATEAESTAEQEFWNKFPGC
jgi:hypothetical protein